MYQVQSTTQNRRKFRQVARDTCGESMEPPDDNLIMFGELAEEKGKFFHALFGQEAWNLMNYRVFVIPFSRSSCVCNLCQTSQE